MGIRLIAAGTLDITYASSLEKPARVLFILIIHYMNQSTGVLIT
jgi:hypothetical protein